MTSLNALAFMRAAQDSLFIAPLELKLADTGAAKTTGEFTGYAAVFGNVDSHGDVIMPGAFKASLEKRASEGRSHVPMHVQHAVLGGDGLPIGVWKTIEEDDKGLRVQGKISGIDTDIGKMHYARLKDGAYGGLSIGFRTKKATDVKGAGPAKRHIEMIDLHEISLVTDPSNAKAIFDEVKMTALAAKAVLTTPNSEKAALSAASGIALHLACLSGSDSPSADERAQLLNHWQDIHEAMTGARMPAGIKAAPQTEREWEKALREIGLSHTQARAFADAGLKSLRPREEGDDQANEQEVKAAASRAKSALDFL